MFNIVFSFKSCKYNKYPGPRPRKHPFLWMTGSFPVPIHENRRFHGQKKTAQSVLSGRRELNYVKAVR